MFSLRFYSISLSESTWEEKSSGSKSRAQSNPVTLDNYLSADLTNLYDTALAAYRRAEEVFDSPRLRADPSTLSLSQPLIEIKPIWARASEVDISTQDFGYTVAALTDGTFVDEFYLDDDKIDIYLYSESGKNASLDSLNQMSVYTPIGAIVPLSSIARIMETVDTNIIRRVISQRTVTLNIIPPEKSRWKPALKS